MTPLCSVGAPTCLESLFDVPKGCISDPPLLVNLLHALNLSSVFDEFKRNCLADPPRNWIVDYQCVLNQNAFLKTLSVDSKSRIRRRKSTEKLSLFSCLVLLVTSLDCGGMACTALLNKYLPMLRSAGLELPVEPGVLL